MKLLLADDHTLFRDTLVQYVERAEPHAEVSLAKDFPEVLAIMDKDPSQDLILLDLRMPGMNGLDGLDTIRERFPDVPVALMSGMAEPHDVQVALEKGAVGYFPKTLSGKSLLKGIQKVLGGEQFLPLEDQSSAIMPSYYDDHSTAGAEVLLSPREREVLSYLARGYSNKEIANVLDLQIVTIKLHVRGICRKLDAKNRTQAAMKAQKMGLVRYA